MVNHALACKLKLRENSYGNIIKIIRAREEFCYEDGFKNGLNQARNEYKSQVQILKQEIKRLENGRTKN